MNEMPWFNMMGKLFPRFGGRKAQGSLEYIMMVSAVSIIIVIALAMMTQLKGTAVHAFYNSSGGSMANALSEELGNLTIR
jgi:hypothetical protein